MEEDVDVARRNVQLDETGPSGIGGQLVAILVGGEADDARLQSERQILGDEGDGSALVGDRTGDCQDPVVVRVGPERGGQPAHVLVVQLDPQRATLVVHRQGGGQRPVLGAQQLERPEALAGGPAELRVVAFALQLGDHREREDHFVLGKAVERPVISEEHRGVEDVHLRLPGRSPGTRCNCRLDPRAGQ